MATWNVRGTYEKDASKNLAQVFTQYDIDIAALQETKQDGIFVTEVDDYVIFNSAEEKRMLDN